MYFENIENITFTSSGKGTINGNGQKWWGAIQFLKHQENRPRLVHIKYSKNILVERLLLKDSPYWTFYAEDSDGLIIRHTDVDARWTNINYHTLIDLQAFNTDGFDVTGNNVHIHDCNIWNQGLLLLLLLFLLFLVVVVVVIVVVIVYVVFGCYCCCCEYILVLYYIFY